MQKILIVVLLAALLFMIGHSIYQRHKQPSGQAIDRLGATPPATTAKNDAKPDPAIDNRRTIITEAVRKAESAVVSISIIKTEVVRRSMSPFNNPLFGFFDVPYRRDVQAIGSGVIFSEDGYILTNAHVVEGATVIKVTLPDGREFNGQVIGIDSVHDVAVLKITGAKLPVAQLGSSSDLMVGEWVIAIGNPYAFLIKDSQPSVSVGVVSALERNFANKDEGKLYKRMIQTDAAINSGNSGGPLVNVNGAVVGINTFIFSESGGNVGLGFAIPIDRVKQIATELARFGKVREAWFGFKVADIQGVEGVVVAQIERNSPAEKAGLQRRDIITAINGQPCRDSDEAILAVSDVSPGDALNLRVARGTQSKTIILRTGEQ
jgi:serine protease Do